MSSAARTPQTQRRYALVTGCSTGGMGWHVARAFAAQGIHTFATLRDVGKAGNLAEPPTTGGAAAATIEILPLDVTSAPSIARCAEEVSRRTGGRLDFLYNNAGAMLVQPVADQGLAAARALFEVNVWGVLAVTQAFLPLLVAAGGLVANAGSIRATLLQEYDAVYGASKAALAKLSENMLVEFAPLGVAVACLNIGGVDTEIFAQHKPSAAGAELPPGSYYQPIGSHIAAIARGDRARSYPGMAPDVFARRVVGDLLNRRTGYVWRGAFASVARIIGMLPLWLFLRLTAYPKSGLSTLAAMREKSDKKAQ